MSTVTDAPLNRVQWPRLSTCSRCAAEILIALAADRRTSLILDAWPVIVGVDTCPTCQGRGRRGTPDDPRTRHHKLTDDALATCPKCGGSGKTGEALTREHVVMSHDGIARRWQQLGGPWSSAYRVHTCAGADA
jgi:hypothetical protein